jgi:hypothetical protein
MDTQKYRESSLKLLRVAHDVVNKKLFAVKERLEDLEGVKPGDDEEDKLLAALLFSNLYFDGYDLRLTKFGKEVVSVAVHSGIIPTKRDGDSLKGNFHGFTFILDGAGFNFELDLNAGKALASAIAEYRDVVEALWQPAFRNNLVYQQ